MCAKTFFVRAAVRATLQKQSTCKEVFHCSPRGVEDELLGETPQLELATENHPIFCSGIGVWEMLAWNQSGLPTPLKIQQIQAPRRCLSIGQPSPALSLLMRKKPYLENWASGVQLKYLFSRNGIAILAILSFYCCSSKTLVF